ncbi:MAG: type II toxin-antitoxin system PemK/MazF family toxin [Candidatus Aerophobetes bacterium]|nr:type II toxin-antitoxin system PemK/MazF family toxin [Candidatus Aerophobetes bacterium]
MLDYPKRGEIHYLDFSPSYGKEIRNIHPALIIQNEVGNQASQLTIVAAITSNLKVAKLPVGVEISPKESGLPHKSVIHLGQIYTVDRRRLKKRVGKLSKLTMAKVDKAIQVSLGLRKFHFS